jgi:hypothetical protein
MTDRGIPPRLGPDIAPPPELQARIRAAIAATPAPRVATRARVAIALAAAPCAAAAVLALATQVVFERGLLRPGLRIDMGAWSPSLLVTLLVLLGLTLAVTSITVARGSHGLGVGAAWLVAVASLVTPVYAALSLSGAAHAAEPLGAVALSPMGLPCLWIATAVGVLVLASLTAALRRSAPAASRPRGAAVGAAAGAWAGLTVFVFCPAGQLRHLLFGHVLPIAAFTLVGLVAVHRALRP